MKPADVQPPVAKVEKWDPDNAVPYLYDAQVIQNQKHIDFVPSPGTFDRLEKEADWRQAMQKAFTAPKYDGYTKRRFELERTWLLDRYQLLTVAENYKPVLLFVVCAGLYLGYYPYAANFHHYMTASGAIHDVEPLFYNILPNYDAPPGRNALPVGEPFQAYTWYALAELILAVIAFIPWPRSKS